MKLTITLGSGDTTAILKEWAEKKYGLAVEEVTSGYSTIPKIEVEMCAKEDAPDRLMMPYPMPEGMEQV